MDKYNPYPGDTEEAVLEQGEYVLNRNAVNAIGKEKLDKINYEMEPRFPDQNEHRMRHAGVMAQRGGQKLSPEEIAALQRSQGQPGKASRPAPEERFNPDNPWDIRTWGRDIRKDSDYNKWLELSMDMRAAKFGQIKGPTNWATYISDPKRKADAKKNLAMGPAAYYDQKIKESGIGMKKFMQMEKDRRYWLSSPEGIGSGEWHHNWEKEGKDQRRDDWAKQIEKREYADKKMDEYRAQQQFKFKQSDEKRRLAEQARNASEERNLVNREEQLARIDKLQAVSQKKWSQMGLPGWEDDAPMKAITSAVSNKPENFGAYLQSTMGSKDKPLSKFDAIGRAESMKEMIHKQAVEKFGDEDYSLATESERKDIENAQSAIDEAKNFALQGYMTPAEAEKEAAKDKMIAKAIEPIQKQDSKMKEKMGNLKSALSSYAGSLLFGQSGGYVKPKGYLIGGLAAGSMALGGLGRLAGAVKEKGGLGQIAQNLGDSAKAGLGRMKEQAAGTDYHFTQAGADKAQMGEDVIRYGDQGLGDVEQFNQLNIGKKKGDAGYVSADTANQMWQAEGGGDFESWVAEDDRVEHKAGAGRGLLEEINKYGSPIAGAAAKLGGEGIGIAKQGLQAAGKGLSKVAGAAKEDWAKGKDSKLQKGLGFLSAMGQEAIAPGYIQSRMDQVREQGVNLKGGDSMVKGGADMNLEQMQAAIPGYDKSKAYQNTTDEEDFDAWMNDDTEYDYGDGSKWKGDLSEGYDESKKNIGLSDDDEFNIWMSQPTDVERKKVIRNYPNRGATSGTRVQSQRGGFISGIGHYQDGGFVSPSNNSRRLMNQARRRYGRIG